MLKQFDCWQDYLNISFTSLYEIVWLSICYIFRVHFSIKIEFHFFFVTCKSFDFNLKENFWEEIAVKTTSYSQIVSVLLMTVKFGLQWKRRKKYFCGSIFATFYSFITFNSFNLIQPLIQTKAGEVTKTTNSEGFHQIHDSGMNNSL